MTQYNVKLSNLKLNKLKSGMKNCTEVTLNISSNIVQNNFLHKLWLANRKVSKLCKAFANSSSANIKLLKTQSHKLEQLGGFIGRLIRPLIKTGLPLIGNVRKPLAKSDLIPMGLTAATSATDAAIQKYLDQELQH